MATLMNIKKFMLAHDVSVVDLNWKMLKHGQLKKLLKWEMNQHPKLGCNKSA